MSVARRHDPSRTGLYTEAERQRRDSSRWTMVQAVLAPLQFLIFLVSLGLVLRTLLTGEGVFAAHISILLKTFALYTIMVTGSLWEKDVFGQYLFAPAFFWEDVVSFVVIGLHTLYIAGLIFRFLSDTQLFAITLAAYATYVVNATQFLLKLRAARLQSAMSSVSPIAEGAR
jgi:3-vinyl bacteriochlorophyllide hydratase